MPLYLSIDLELPSMASNLRAARIQRSKLDELDTRLDRQVNGLLTLLDRLGLKATIFTVGPVAERHPLLLDLLKQAGHGIACHGYDHLNLRQASMSDASQDLHRATAALEPWLPPRGQRGFRAPDFSLDAHNTEFRRQLVEEGYGWSSSIMRARQPGTGTLPLELQQGRPWCDPETGLWELPLGGMRPFGFPLAHGGGFWLRVLPLQLNRWGLAADLRCGALAQIYLHPWELDPDQPRLVSGWRGFRQYAGQAGMADRLQDLCAGEEVRPLEEAWPGRQ